MQQAERPVYFVEVTSDLCVGRMNEARDIIA